MYSSGIETKNKIVETAKKLFYENGLQGTTGSMITRNCKQRQSLFFYYFKDILELAEQIYGEFQKIHYDLIADSLKGDYSHLELINIRGLSHLRLVLTDKSLCRFVSQVNYSAGIQANRFVRNAYQDAADEWVPKDKLVTGDFILAQALSLSACLFRMHSQDNLSYSIDEIIEMKIESSLRSFYLEDELLNYTKQRCLQAEQTLVFKHIPYFDIKAV